jgi:ribosome-interacting GTPase 1
MPTNLPAEYYNVEELFRAARTTEDKIRYLEEMLGTIPKHKGTDHLRADLRRKLSQLRDSAESQRKGGRRVSPYVIEKEGAGRVAVIGPPNVGKSALVAALTNASPDVADYPFTTQFPLPGMMPIENIQVQLIDTPPLSRDFDEPQLFNLIRGAELMLLIVDLQTFPIEQLEESITLLDEARIVPTHLYDPAEEPRHVTVIPLLIVANKTDDPAADADFEVLCELVGGDWPLIPFSATEMRGVDRFKAAVYDALNIIRIYSKPPGRQPDHSAPFVLRKGSTVEEFAAAVHRDFVDNLKSARIWGTGVYDGQMVGRDHVLHDGDIVELRA